MAYPHPQIIHHIKTHHLQQGKVLPTQAICKRHISHKGSTTEHQDPNLLHVFGNPGFNVYHVGEFQQILEECGHDY
jgi:hypothetical protein